MSGNNEKINPAVKTTTIGVRVLRDVQVFPLSISEQVKLGETVTELITGFVEGLIKNNEGKDLKTLAQLENVELVEFILKLIKDNVNKIVEITTDEKPDDFLSDCTNEQFTDFALLIFEMNYSGETRKKFVGLVQKVAGTLNEQAPKKKKKAKVKK